ncbi:transcription elongation factor elongin A [Glossina fuscipes fuscipes]
MSSTTSIVEVIQHYQRSIGSSQDDEARLLHCINKLYKLPIKVEHLQETGVGKTVNSLRKYNGEIGVAAKTLVTKWKAMVAAEEEPADAATSTSSAHRENGRDSGENDDEESYHRNNSSPKEEKKDKEQNIEQNYKDIRSHSKDICTKPSSLLENSSDKNVKNSNEQYHKSSSSSSLGNDRGKDKERHHKSRSSNGGKDRGRDKDKRDHKDKHKERDEERDRKEIKPKPETTTRITSGSNSSSSNNKKKNDEKHKHHSQQHREKTDNHKHRAESKQKSSSRDNERRKERSSNSAKEDESPEGSCGATSNKNETSERKRRRNSDDDSNDFLSPRPKVVKMKTSSRKDSKIENENENDEEGGFDSSTGANFADVLGMLNAPTKKVKKSVKSSSSPASSTSKLSSSSYNNSANSPYSSSSKTSALKTMPTYNYTPTSGVSTPVSTKPDLLAPTAKLEPLDPSIALELPTISTNYKPMPLNQTVMDCVFNTNMSSSSKPIRTLTDAEALNHGISSKTMRTKIYSGAKTGQILQVPSLFDLCIRILQKNIDALEYTGGVPFEVLRPVLERATPHQLLVFEDYNPYLMEDSDVLWQLHVQRNYRTQKRLENESWREMYLRCQEDQERKLNYLADSIKQSQKIAAAPVRKTQLAFVDSMVKPPRNIQRKQEQFGTQAKLVATPAARVASLSSVTPNAAKTDDVRLKVASSIRDHAQVSSAATVRPKKAPLMQKTLQFIRGRHKR